MPKKLLVVGCGMSQIPTFISAKKLDVEIVGVDFNPNACAVYMADAFEKCDTKDLNGVLEIAEKHEVNGIVVPGTDFPETGAYVSEIMGFPTTPREVARLCVDKLGQKRFLQERGFLVPDIQELRSETDLYHIVLPVVIKPNDNMAARGSKKLHYTRDISDTFEEALKQSRSNTVVVEKFVEGMELSVDSLVWEGEVYVFAVADRHFALDPYFIEVGHTMPSVLNLDLQREVIDIFTRAVKALGITHGSAKGDLKITDRGIMILEIANRISGGVLSGWTVPFATGYFPHDDLVRIHLGEEPLYDNPQKKLWSAERNILTIPGVVKEIQSCNMTNSRPNFIHFHADAGDKVNFPTNNAERFGSAVTSGVTREGTIRSADNVVQDILVRLEPNNKDTENFIKYEHSEFKMFETIKKENDWHGIDFAEALEKVFVATEKKYSDIKSRSEFWKYFYKGGVQGGVYFCDTYL